MSSHRAEPRQPSRLTAVAPVLIVSALALGALVVSLILRGDADAARRDEVMAAQAQREVDRLDTIQHEALAHGRFSPRLLGEWRRTQVRADAYLSRLADRDDEEARLAREARRSLGALARPLDAERRYLDRGDIAAALRADKRRTDPTLEALDRKLAEIGTGDEQEAAETNRAATSGTLLAFAIAALLISVLLRRVQGVARRRTERHFRALVEQASDVILVVDSQGLVTLASGGVPSQLRRTPESLLGQRLVDLLHPKDIDLVLPLLAEARERRPAHASTEWRIARGDGSYARVDAAARDLTDDDSVRGFVLTNRDISQRKDLEDQLRHQAFHDPLTHLPNRALFDDRLAHALSRDQREDRYVAVLFLDLDDFKIINDSLGHSGGDQLLVAVAGRLRSCLRSADTAARLGGDEFGVVLEGLGNRDEAAAAAKRVLDTLREPFFLHGEPTTVQASIGVAAASGRSARAEQLVRDADVAMYLAKHNGKSRYEVYDRDLQGDLLERLDIAGEDDDDGVTWFLRSEEQRTEVEALLADEGSITPVFQPIVDLGTGTVVGYEALARFPDVGGRPPNAWFAQAHRFGLGVELEMLAVRAALRAEGRPAGTYLTLNLSPSAVVSDQLEQNLPDDLSELAFEIVETELISEGSRLELVLDRLRARGAQIAVDDTGSGYAGLKQLMRLRPEIIKLDRSLIDGLHADLAKRALVDSMVRYARRIDASVCAEGVETLEDLQTLADIDIASAQGYVLARPGPPWAQVDPAAAQVCANSMRAALGEAVSPVRSAGAAEQRLEGVSRAILGSRWPADLHRAVEAIAAELDAERAVLHRLTDEATELETVTSSGVDTGGERFPLEDYPAAASVVRDGRALQFDVADSEDDANQAALLVRRGISSSLMLPVTTPDRTLGVLGIQAAVPRAWTRSEIYRAWIFAHELGAALAAFEREGKEIAAGRLAHRNDFAATGIEWMRLARGNGAGRAKETGRSDRRDGNSGNE